MYATPWPEPVETHRVHTSDGWELDLRHVKPTAKPLPAPPVIVVHGIVTNGRNCDVDESHSLARELAKRGFDVWIPSLRGTGESEKRWLATVDANESDFDAYVTRDIPAVIDYVREKTGAREVDYVGHSMGGMILYGYLTRGGPGIARAVTLGSPVWMRWTGRIEQLVRAGAPFARAANLAPLRTTVMSTLPIQGSLDGPVERLLISPENTSVETWQKFMAVGVDDVPGGLGAQFASWMRRGRFDSEDKTIDYLNGLQRVTVPFLVIAGKIDGIAPPWMVRPAYEALGSTRKQWIVLGEANGQSADYNHMDMLLGDRASTDVFPLIAAFLASE